MRLDLNYLIQVSTSLSFTISLAAAVAKVDYS